MTFARLQDLLRLTLSHPRGAAAQLMSLELSVGTGWMAMVLVSVASAVTGYVGFAVSPLAVDPALSPLFASPFNTAILQFGVLSLTGVLAYWVGALFKGTGSLAQALVLVAWAQVPPILLQLAQLVAMLVIPALAPLIGLASFALYAVLLALFIAQLHGFRSGVVVFFGLIVVSFLVALVAAVVFAILLGVPSNV